MSSPDPKAHDRSDKDYKPASFEKVAKKMKKSKWEKGWGDLSKIHLKPITEKIKVKKNKDNPGHGKFIFNKHLG